MDIWQHFGRNEKYAWEGTHLAQQTYEFNPLSLEFQQDRYAVFKKVHTHCPIYKEPQIDRNGRVFTLWHFTTYEDVQFAFRDKRFVIQLKNALPADQLPPTPPEIRVLEDHLNQLLVLQDRPDHTRLRSLINKTFTPRLAEQLEPRIHDISRYLLQEFEPGTTIDLVRDYANQLPIFVITELMGVPVEDRYLIKKWSTQVIRSTDHKPTKEMLVNANQAMIEFQHYFRELIHDRSRSLRDDLISKLIRATYEEGHMSEDELLANCIGLVLGGHETTASMIASSIYLMIRYQEQQNLLRAQPEWMESAIEEVLRFETPFQLRHRKVAEDMEYKGHALKRGDSLTGWIAAANRDPDVFVNPDQFDITRKKNPHLAFGYAAHFCLGAPLARKEGAIALQTLFDKYTHLKLVNEQVEWMPFPSTRTLKSLDVLVY